jgi:hypothetical protein
LTVPLKVKFPKGQKLNIPLFIVIVFQHSR